MTLKERLKNNLLVTIASTVVLASSALVAAERTFGFIDRSVVTESELATHAEHAHPAALDAIADGELKSECRWLRSEIRTIRDQIREMQDDGADPVWVGEKVRELEELEEHFSKRKCITVDYI